MLGSIGVAGAILMDGVVDLVDAEHDLAVARGQDDPMLRNMMDGQIEMLEQTRMPTLVDGGFTLVVGVALMAAGIGICLRSGFWRRAALALLASKLVGVVGYAVYTLGWHVPQLREYFALAEDTIQRGGGRASFARVMVQWTYFVVVVTAVVSAVLAGVSWWLVKMRATRRWCGPQPPFA